MYIKNKSVYFLFFALCLMLTSIVLSLQTQNNVLVSATTLYMSMDGESLAKEHMEVVISDNKFEAVTVIKEAGLDKPLDIFTKGEFHNKDAGLFNVSISEEYISNIELSTRDNEVLLYNKYLDARRKLSFFKSVQVVEKLPHNYKLIISNSPVKKMIAIKMGKQEEVKFYNSY
ncbi:hypothetical protein NB545_17560 [Vibrio campbellii]|uniref:hypothetical protein n=1 Tax=Vibrio TaxID=662 RepID=UPI0003A7ABDF|nr:MULTISPECIES: hypothetical protein [Vibrio]MCR9909247.1 hypothetical protein [Vibrio campbellii]OQQ05308.1 hypothetical protein BK412_05875 [Vibrio campbellii]CAE6913962.1 hypothetical protein ACOMICROBIO_LKFPLAJE_02248 [Vibrio sp. B1FIG11]